MEETATVSPSATTAEALVPHLKKCGYGDAQLARPFKVGDATIEVAAFAGRPFDNWSACLAVVDLAGDSRTSASKARHLGAASVFVCGPHGVDWYGLGANGPTTPRSINWVDVPGLFREHRKELAPSTIYDAKLRRPGAKPAQMWFFDAGLMPAVEKNRGETLLRLVENAMSGLHTELGAKLDKRQAQEDVYRTVFWQLAAKVLHDKGVPNFKQIDLTDVDQVFDRIGKHHGVTDRFPPFGKEGRPAINAMARTISECGSLRDVSSESIAYVYENALLDKAAGKGKPKTAGEPYDIRKELGIHSTPSVLIHHMLSQMWGMVEEIAPDDRVVFEPACGHAPFLTGAMRWLRSWDARGRSETDHDYMRKHVRGVEADAFAIELAKLALTLADEPHGNSWAIQPGDMFAPGLLAKEAKKARILLSNPPYEAFEVEQKRRYAKLGEPVTANTKAVEMLKRTLPHLTAGSVFGVVMPVGVLHDKESKPVRAELLRDFDLSEISVFADNLFEHADHEVAVLMGRKKKPRTKPPALMYRRVREAGMAAFKERLEFSREESLPISELARAPESSLWVPDLREVWAYCDQYPRLGKSFTVTKGHEFFKAEVLKAKGLLSKSPKPGWLPVALNPKTPYTVVALPIAGYLNYGPKTYRSRGGGATPGHPQVVINEAGPRSPWRFRAVEDPTGIAIKSRFLVVRQKDGAAHTRLSVWAFLNSPVANAYGYCWSGKRQTTPKEWLAFPLPEVAPSQLSEIEHAAARYRSLVIAKAAAKPAPIDLFNQSAPSSGPAPTNAEVRAALLAMDAAVLRAYDLPPRLERQLLDLFTGVERKGVGLDGPGGKSTFRGYYPLGFTSALPLHMVISEQFERALADKTAERFKPADSPYVRDVLSGVASAKGEV